MLYNVISGLFKLLLASLAVGYALSAVDLSAHDVLTEIGMTPEALMRYLATAAQWAVPHLILGAMVIVPVWFIIYLFKPPNSK